MTNCNIEPGLVVRYREEEGIVSRVTDTEILIDFEDYQVALPRAKAHALEIVGFELDDE